MTTLIIDVFIIYGFLKLFCHINVQFLKIFMEKKLTAKKVKTL